MSLLIFHLILYTKNYIIKLFILFKFTLFAVIDYSINTAKIYKLVHHFSNQLFLFEGIFIRFIFECSFRYWKTLPIKRQID